MKLLLAIAIASLFLLSGWHEHYVEQSAKTIYPERLIRYALNVAQSACH